MTSSEEETYSTIFASLKHPVRRRILRMLSNKPGNFSEMLEALRISSSHLTYHLESLGDLVSKTDDGRYRLSAFGEAAVTTMTKVEEAPKVMELRGPRSLSTKWTSFFVVLIIGLFAFACVSYSQSLNRLSSEYEDLSGEYEELSELFDHVAKGATFQSEYTLRYEFEMLDSGFLRFGGFPWYCVIYNPYDNSTLYLLLMVDTVLTRSYLPHKRAEGQRLCSRTQ